MRPRRQETGPLLGFLTEPEISKAAPEFPHTYSGLELSMVSPDIMAEKNTAVLSLSQRPSASARDLIAWPRTENCLSTRRRLGTKPAEGTRENAPDPFNSLIPLRRLL